MNSTNFKKIEENAYNNMINSIDFPKIEFKDSFLAGTYLAFCIKAQVDYFKTRGLIKKISMMISDLNPARLFSLIGYASELEHQVFERQRKRRKPIFKSFLSSYFQNFAENYKDKKFDASSTDITLYFSWGYAFYYLNSQKASYLKNNPEEIDNLKYGDSYNSHTLELIELPHFSQNKSIKLGIDFGNCYFQNEYLQLKIFKTASLASVMNSLLKQADISTIKRYMREILQVSFRILSKPPMDEVKEDENNSDMRLLEQSSYLNFFKNLNSMKKFDKNDFLIGLLISKTLIDNRIINSSKNNGIKDEKSGENVSLLNVSEIQSPKKYRIRKDEEIIELLNHENFSNDEISAFLLGVMLDRLIYDEKEMLGTKRLQKKFIFIFRNLKIKNQIIFAELARTYLSCWVSKEKRSNSHKYIKNLKIRMKLIKEYGKSSLKENCSNLSISLMRGYELSLPIKVGE